MKPLHSETMYLGVVATSGLQRQLSRTCCCVPLTLILLKCSLGDEMVFDCLSGRMFVCFVPSLFINSSFYVAEVNWFY